MEKTSRMCLISVKDLPLNLRERLSKLRLREPPGRKRIISPSSRPTEINAKESIDSDQKAKALREEVLRALATLEQMDIER